MITTVFLDVDNTLLDFSEGSRRCMAEGFRAFGIPYKDEMFSVFHTINSRLWRRVEDGTLTREELFEIRWNTIFEALGIQADGVAFEAEFRRQLRDSAIPMEGAEELLQYLHQKKYTLVIASNAVREQQVRRLTKAGLFPYIDLVATSEEAGYAKPKKEFFDYCLSLLPPETTPQQIMMIGDSLAADIGGGQAYGLKTCWFNYHHEENTGRVHPDYTVTALRELFAIL